MDILQYNIRGLANNRTDIDILNHLYKPTLFCLQETHIKENNPPQFHNFNIIHNHNPKATQGVAFLVKKESKYTQIPLTTNFQAIAIKINIPHTVHICNIYIHPSDKINEIEFQNLIDQLPQPRIILGDFNAHNPLWKSITKNPRGTAIENLINNNNLICINREGHTYHHPSTGTASIIDLTICNPSIATKLTWRILEQQQSDHLPILISTLKPNNNNNPQHSPPNTINYHHINWTTFQETLESTTIDQNSHLSINQRIDLLTNNITSALLSSQIKHKPIKHKNPVPWWSKELSALRKDKNRALKKFTKQPTSLNRTIFNQTKVKFRDLIKSQKESSWNQFIDNINLSTTPKDFWNQINKVAGKKTLNNITSLNINGNIIQDPFTIANTLATSFTNSSTNNVNRRKYILKSSKKLNIVPTQTVHQINQSISYIEFNIALHNTKNSSSPGFDNINYQSIKNLPQQYIFELIDIYNLILSEGEFPSQWKKAKIIPILKPNSDPFQPNSYRPISLLSCLSKLLEKIIAKRIQYWITTESLMTPNQIAYQIGLSTTDALIKVSSYLIESLNNHNHVDSLALDMTKAFDKCWPETIVAQIRKWGLSGPLLNLIHSFLTNRQLQITYKTLNSNTHPLVYGVPQGSPLSALLFIIAINSLSELLNKVPRIQHTFFADDFQIYCSFKKKMSNNIQTALNKIEKWCKSMGFEISTSKNQHIHFCRLKNCTRKSYTIYNTPIAHNNTLKYLGLLFDNKLTFKQHIEYTSTKNSRTLNIIKILSHPKSGINTNNLIKITNTLIRSSLEYGCQIYSTANKGTLKKINTIYNTAIRTSLGALRTSPIESIHKEAGTYLLTDRIQELTTKYILKVKSTKDHPNHSLISTSSPNNNRLKSGLQKTIEYLASTNFATDSIYPITKTTFPPWHQHNLQTDTTLTHILTKSDNPTIQKLESIKLINEYSNHLKIYTDGSKTTTSTSYAIHSEDLNITRKVKISPTNSIFFAESKAILEALTYNRPNPIAIFSDSLSVIKATASNKPHHNNIINLIKAQLTHSNNKKLIWIPSHTGLKGNEIADRLANEAHSHPDQIDDVISFTDMYHSFINEQNTRRLSNWENSTSKLKLIYNSPDNNKSTPINRTRADAVFLIRLRIGHTPKTHNYIFNRTPQPGCTHCQKSLTIYHIFSQCNRPDLITLKKTHNTFNLTIQQLLDKKTTHITYLRQALELY